MLVGVKEYLFRQSLPTLKAQSRLQETTLLNILNYFSQKISHDISSESSAWQTIHKKYQDIFYEK